MAEVIPIQNSMPDDDVAPLYSDEALALAFGKEYEGFLRFVAMWGYWLIYDGKRWARDETLDVYSFVRFICRKHANNAPEKYRRDIASASTVAAVERLSRASDGLAATVSQWDADPWRINTPDGMIDPTSGTNYGHSELDYAMKITGVSPAVLKRECPVWQKFLDRITGGDGELQRFLARVFGYALTGSTREHALFFFYGTGANGKSVLIDTMTGIVGDYATTASIETFTSSTFDRHPTDLARLQGARLVTATETEEGRAWAEARIKSLTGGDKISAR